MLHRDEVEIRHVGNFVPPTPTVAPVTFTTAVSPTTPFYTTVTPFDHSPPRRTPSPAPAYRPVRHKRQKSKEAEFDYR